MLRLPHIRKSGSTYAESANTEAANAVTRANIDYLMVQNVWEVIWSYLDKKDLINILLFSKHMQTNANNSQFFWQLLIIRSFGKSAALAKNEKPKEYYQKNIKELKNLKDNITIRRNRSNLPWKKKSIIELNQITDKLLELNKDKADVAIRNFFKKNHHFLNILYMPID